MTLADQLHIIIKNEPGLYSDQLQRKMGLLPGNEHITPGGVRSSLSWMNKNGYVVSKKGSRGKIKTYAVGPVPYVESYERQSIENRLRVRKHRVKIELCDQLSTDFSKELMTKPWI